MTAGVDLYDHQIDGASWLAEESRRYLGDKPGLGKTRTLLAASMAAGESCPLVIAPAIVRSHWLREGVVLGMSPLVASYDHATRGGPERMRELLAHKPRVLLLDEAHYLKHGTSERTKAVLGADGYARRIPYVYAGSGTPVPKNPDEFWTILASLFPERCKEYGLDSHQKFLDTFCVVRPRFIRGAWRDKIMAECKNPSLFRELLRPILLTRDLDDVGLDVPELDFQMVRLDATEARNEWYETGTVYAQIEGAIDAGELESIANDPHVARMRRRLGELKVAPVAEMLSAQLAGNDEKVAVFAYHRSVLGSLRELLGTFGVAYIDGDTGPRARDDALARFQDDPSVRVFLGQNGACGTGTDGLHRATNRAVLVEPDWTAANNVQLGKRVARIGSTRGRCTAQMIALAGTLDEAIVSQHHRETALAASLGI